MCPPWILQIWRFFTIHPTNLDDPAIELVKKLREVEERQKQDIQKKYDTGEIVDYSKNKIGNGKAKNKKQQKQE